VAEVRNLDAVALRRLEDGLAGARHDPGVVHPESDVSIVHRTAPKLAAFVAALPFEHARRIGRGSGVSRTRLAA
jgi:hypothetical protein